MMKRTLSFLISFVMIATMVSLPAGVFAGENAGNGTDGEIKSISAVHVNPLYEDIIDESEIIVPEETSVPEDDPYANKARTLRSSGYLTTEADVVKALRDAMEERQETITLYYQKAASSNYTKQIFHDLIDAAMAHTGVPTEGDYLKWHWGSWGANLSWRTNGNTDYLTLIYNIKYYTTAEQEAQVDQTVDEVLRFLDLDAPGKSEYVQVKAIYDYICSNVVYDDANAYDTAYTLKHTAYAAFIDGIAVCQGYALMFYRLALETGIDARIIAGDFNNYYTGPDVSADNHGWNIVEIDDKYYNLDSTWDGDESPYKTPYNHKFFMMSGETAASAFDSNHIRWTEYDTAAFHSTYPMSAQQYTATSSDGADISSWQAHLEYDLAIADGTAKTPGVIVPGLVEGTDYEVTYTGDNVNAGSTVTVTIKGIGNYTGTIIKTFFIGEDITPKKSVTSLSQTTYTYDGTEKRPDVIIEGLTEGQDFKTEYRDNINAGTGTVTITGMGDYVGSFDMTFTIEPVTIDSSNTSITLSAYAFAYDGGYKSPDAAVVYGGKTLVNGKDFILSYENNLYPGTAGAVVTGKGNYKGSLTSGFTIAEPVIPAPRSVKAALYGYDDMSVKWSSIAVPGASPVYKVEYQRGNNGWTVLKDGITAASVKKANLADGARYRFRVTPYVILDGKPYYGKAKTSSYVYTLKKVPKPEVSKKSGSSIKISWTNIQGETGYQIARSAKKNKGYSTVRTVKGAKAKSAVIKASGGRSYYYKVRAYKTVNGKKICGPWSKPVKYELN